MEEGHICFHILAHQQQTTRSLLAFSGTDKESPFIV